MGDERGGIRTSIAVCTLARAGATEHKLCERHSGEGYSLDEVGGMEGQFLM